MFSGGILGVANAVFIFLVLGYRTFFWRALVMVVVVVVRREDLLLLWVPAETHCVVAKEEAGGSTRDSNGVCQCFWILSSIGGLGGRQSRMVFLLEVVVDGGSFILPPVIWFCLLLPLSVADGSVRSDVWRKVPAKVPIVVDFVAVLSLLRIWAQLFKLLLLVVVVVDVVVLVSFFAMVSWIVRYRGKEFSFSSSGRYKRQAWGENLWVHLRLILPIGRVPHWLLVASY